MDALPTPFAQLDARRLKLPRSRAATALVWLVLAATGHCHAEPLLYSVDRSPPHTVIQAADSVTVRFGPVQFRFPAGWRFGSAHTMSEGIGPQRGKVYISVLQATSEARASGFAPLHGVEPAALQLARHVQQVCGMDQLPPVHRLPAPSKRAVIAAGCEVEAEDFAYVQYEIYTVRSAVQVLASGLGTLNAMRKTWDDVVLSQVWSDDE